MSSTTSLRARRRAGALLCAGVLAGGTLAASPATAAPEPDDRAGSASVAPAPNRGMAASPADPNADGYDSFIVTYKETAANSTAKGRAHAWGKAAKEAGVSVKELRETALGSHVISTGKKLTQDESAAFMADLRASGAVDAVEPNAIMTANALSPVDQYYSQ